MPIISTFQRYELKYCIPKALAKELYKRITEYMYPDEYCLNGKHYSIYNIYFDNDQDELINTSLKKPFFKEKLRIRGYNSNATEISPVFLEIKRKINKVVTKRRAIISYKQALDLMENGIMPTSTNYLDSQVLKEEKYLIDTYQIYPKVYIRYDRMAFFSKENDGVRLTFDSKIRARRYNLRFDGNERGNIVMPDNMILVEIKINGCMPIWLENLLDELDIQRTGYTKYGNEYKNIYLPDYLKYTN